MTLGSESQNYAIHWLGLSFETEETDWNYEILKVIEFKSIESNKK